MTLLYAPYAWQSSYECASYESTRYNGMSTTQYGKVEEYLLSDQWITITYIQNQ